MTTNPHGSTLLVRVLAAASILCGAGAALAHGPAPAIIGVAAAGPEGPVVLRLSAGLAARGSDGWRYLCGAAWGGPEAPVAASADGETTFIAADGGLYSLIEGAVSNVGVADVDAATTLALVRDGDHVWSLSLRGGAAEVWRLGDAAPLWISPAAWTGLAAHDGDLVLGRVGADGLHVLRLAPNGEELGDAVHPDVPPGSTVSLRSAGALYAVLRDGATQDVRRIEESSLVPIATSDGALFGPVATPEGPLLGLGGALVAIVGDGTTPFDSDRTYTCLEGVTGQVFACSQRDLFAVAGGAVSGPVASVADLLPPEETVLDPVGDCLAQWADFAGEAGIAAEDPADGDAGTDASDGAPAADAGSAAAPHEPAATSGCATRNPMNWLGIFAALGWAAFMRRARRSHHGHGAPGGPA